MKSDDIEQLKELVAFLKENDIAEFDWIAAITRFG